VSNIFTRRILAGEFTILNKHLLKELVNQGLWDNDMKQEILYNNGSVQNIDRVPENLKKLYKTAFEIKQKVIIDLARDRARFVCQSQSMNLFIEKPTYNLLTNIHFYGWKQGLKTGSYYIRTKPSVNSQKFTLDVSKENELKKKYECIGDVCVMCEG
jgi:ribonucleotide reductase alpha subunit